MNDLWQRPAVVALHYQNEVMHPEGKIRFGFAEGAGGREAVAAAARHLLDGARALDVPVVSVRISFRPDYREVPRNTEIFRRVVASRAMQEGSWGAQFFDGLAPRADEFVVHHSRINGFYGSQLDEILTVLGARTLIMGGIATNYVVEHTARHAADAGYNVVIARDACSAATQAAHEASLAAMSVLATVMTAEEAIAAVATAAGR